MGMHKVRAVCSFVCSFVHDTRIRTSRIFLMGKLLLLLLFFYADQYTGQLTKQ